MLSGLFRTRLSEHGSECEIPFSSVPYSSLMNPKHQCREHPEVPGLAWNETVKCRSRRDQGWQMWRVTSEGKGFVIYAQFAVDAIWNTAVICDYEELLECELLLWLCALKIVVTYTEKAKQAETCYTFGTFSVHRNSDPSWETHHQRVAVERNRSKQLYLKRSQVG